MNIIVSNGELLQAIIEIMSALFCLIAFLILQINNRTKITKNVSVMLITDAVSLITDAFAYLVRGNVSVFCIVANRICNFISFTTQLALVLLAFRLTYVLVKQYGATPRKVFLNIAYIITTISFVILITSQFTDFMYYFDDMNIYHRNTGFYFFNALTCLVIILNIIFVLHYKSKLDKGIIVGVFLYEFLPLCAATIQAFCYGLILTQLSSVISLLVLLYLNIRVIERKYSGVTEASREARKTLSMVFMIMFLVIILSSSLLFNIKSLQKIVNENALENNQTQFFMVRNGIENELLKPIIISDTLAQDVSLKKLLSDAKTNPKLDISDGIALILNAIKNGFNYKMVFAASEGNHNYYTYKGFSRHFDVETTQDDRWYRNFISSGKIYELNTDADKDNGKTLSVFVNRLVCDDDNKLLGVCGVGVDMQSLSSLIMDYENTYGMKITLIDPDGVVKISSDMDEIDLRVLDNKYFNNIDKNKIYSDRIDDADRLTMYIENLGWYLAITYNKDNIINVHKIVWPSILIFFMGTFVLVIVFSIMFEREKATVRALEESKNISNTDELTGLANLRAYDTARNEIIHKKTQNEYVIAMLDINGLKYANDNFGHEAGDELIISTAECAKKAFGTYGNIYRTGGDEFYALLKCSEEEMKKAVIKFNEITDAWKGVKNKKLYVSIGYVLVSDFPGFTFDEMERVAEEYMYENKNEFYVKSGMERRKV